MRKGIVSIELKRQTLRTIRAEARRQRRSVSGLVDLWLAAWVIDRRRAERAAVERDGQ